MFEIRYYDLDSIQALLTFTYVRAKGYWYGVFFGWRETVHDNVGRFFLPRKAWEDIDIEIDYYNKFVAKKS